MKVMLQRTANNSAKIPGLACPYMIPLRPIVAFLASMALGAAVPHPDDVYILTEADMQRARGFIATGDNPGLLADSFGGHPRVKYDDRTATILNQLIERNLFNCFISFFPRVLFDGHALKRVRRLFDCAAAAHRFEICDYLLSIPWFHIGDREFGPLCSWNMAALRRLIAGHPNRAGELVPALFGLPLCGDAESILTVLDVMEFCRTVNAAFAENADYHPSNLFSLVVQNDSLDDVGMARVLGKVLSMGPVVEAAAVEGFRQRHPDFDASNRILSDYVEVPIKEPEIN